MKTLLKLALTASTLFATSQAYAVGVSCQGGRYAVSLTEQNYIEISDSGYAKARGIATQSDSFGWQSLSISANVGPQPQDVSQSFTLVVPSVVGAGMFYGYLDVRFAGFGTPGRVTRNTLMCTPQ